MTNLSRPDQNFHQQSPNWMPNTIFQPPFESCSVDATSETKWASQSKPTKLHQLALGSDKSITK